MSKVKQDKQKDSSLDSAVGVAPSEQSADNGKGSDKAALFSAWRKTLAASRLLQVLGVVLVAQLVLAGGLYWNAGRDGNFVVAEELLAFDDSKADRLLITSADEKLALTRAEGVWQLEGDQVLPADGEKVDRLLSQLAGLKAGLPVATSTSAREQLEVAENDFQRHVTVQQGDEVLADLYVGTSPGYQRAHVRRAGQDAIVSAKLNVYDLPDNADGWMDRTLLSFDEVSHIQTEDFTLAKVDEQWKIEAPEARVSGHQVATEPMDKLLDTLQGLRVTGLATELADEDAVSAKDESQADEGATEELNVIAWTITDKGGEPLTLTLTERGSDVTVQRSDRPQTFKVAVSVFNALNDVDLDVLLPETAADEAAEGADGDASAASNPGEAMSATEDGPADESAVRTMSAE